MSTLRTEVEVHRFIVGGSLSHFRRLAAAGVSLACAGIFLGAPAQAATAQHASPAAGSGRTVAKAAGSSATSGYKSFSSTAEAAGHTTVGKRAVLASSTAKATAGTASIIYVEPDLTPCTSEIGAGTADDPYCLLQSAVNAAVSGTTIEVYNNYADAYEYNESISISGKSNLTIVGEGTGVGDSRSQGYYGLDISNSTGITIRNLVLQTNAATTATVYSSSNITLDQDSLIDENQLNTLNIMSSTNVAVTRSTLASTSSGDAIDVETGNQNVTLASDVIYTLNGTGIEADGAKGLDIVGDTIARSCPSAVNVTATSTSVSIENNVIEAPSASACTTYASDIAVDSTSAAGTTTDYNDFIFDAESTAAYTWSGKAYATLAAFQAAVPQGAHDAVDPTRDVEMFLSPANMSGTPVVDAAPTSASLSVGTANTSAPGYLTTDFYGRSSYADRGALKYVAPSLTAALTVYQDSARVMYADPDASVQRDAYATYTYNWGDGSATTAASNTGNQMYTYTSPGIYKVTVTVADAFGDSSSATVSAETAGSDYTPVGPVRVLDTRKGTGTNGVIASVGSGKTLTLAVGGVGSVPSTATAVALNITVTDTKGHGFITAYEAGASVPISSNVNFGLGQTVANMAIVPIGTNGDIKLYNGGTGSVDLVADEAGYFVPAQSDGFASMSAPVRLLDTRTTTGGHHAPLTQTDPVKLKVAGVGGVPADVKAVAVNLTVASPTGAGYIRAYPDNGTVPGVSNVNFTANQVIANAAIVPVGADGYIDVVLTGGGSLRMIVDVNGYFTANMSESISSYEPVTPFRYLDTRQITDGALPSGYYYYLPLGTDFWGNVVPLITGVVSNATVTAPTAVNGDLIVFPDNTGSNGYPVIPTTSTLNFVKGATVPNLSISAPGSDGDIDYYNQSAGSLQLIVDVSGFFQSS
jgi:hypothetical protein